MSFAGGFVLFVLCFLSIRADVIASGAQGWKSPPYTIHQLPRSSGPAGSSCPCCIALYFRFPFDSTSACDELFLTARDKLQTNFQTTIISPGEWACTSWDQGTRARAVIKIR